MCWEVFMNVTAFHTGLVVAKTSAASGFLVTIYSYLTLFTHGCLLMSLLKYSNDSIWVIKGISWLATEWCRRYIIVCYDAVGCAADDFSATNDAVLLGMNIH